ncbi:centromere protein R isoform X2 [Oryctolagus cuniculus]
MSPFTSPTSSKEGEHRNGPSNGKRRKLNHLNLMGRKESTTKVNDEFMTMLSKVEKSSDKIMEIMQNLNSIQALKGNRELENLIGISYASCFLKREMEKTKELMIKVTKQKRLEKKNSRLPHKGLHLPLFLIPGLLFFPSLTTPAHPSRSAMKPSPGLLSKAK